MKAISLTQPWATLVAIGAKRIETRSWSTSYRGPIAIHASKGFPGWAKETCDEEPFYGQLVKHGFLWPLGDETLTAGASERFAALPLGAIVGVSYVRSCIRTEKVIGLDDQECQFGDFATGRWAWLLGDVRLLKKAIPCKGALGLWDVPPEIARQLETV